MRRRVLIYHRSGSAKTPTRAYDGDAGDDLYTSQRVIVPARSAYNIPTDIRVKLPSGFYGRIIGRSSTVKKYGFQVIEGVIDNGYTGELFVSVVNPSDYDVPVEMGDRLAQLILCHIVQTEYVEVIELPHTERGSSGFGSSGA